MVVEMTTPQSNYIPSPAQVWIKNHTNVPRELPQSFIEAYRKKYGLNNQTGDKENVPTD